ncbi:unnamed protein product [Spirodela intermedia]|uniref:Uncharacterized protein n=1 Tax=Spirodela intermedia TaxID=51605 RepID=A0A7I8JMH6_SPIIN|nr:unnamed protein product [Spirodela intermedia]CAA6670672.1 unnamed protein product [Spirodela intermedia]
MRKLCPNFDREDGLETVFEVPIPEEMFAGGARCQQAVASWLRSPACGGGAATAPLAGRNAELQLLLNVVGSPLVPFPVPADPSDGTSIRNLHGGDGGAGGAERCAQHVRAGKVTMRASEFRMGDEEAVSTKGNAEVGGFVLWQKNPDLWFLELVLSGCKLSAGSDGKLAWRQSSSEQSHASRGPPRPLRRSLQGLDPRATAGLFSEAVCIGEKVINNEDCFILKLEANPAALRARSSGSFEIIHHTIWGYFSQRTGLLTQLEDCHLLRMKANRRGESIFWETSMESAIEDYRYIDGINIAHGGRTMVTLFRYGEGSANHKRKMEETWSIEEVDFNILGLSMDCFLPPLTSRSTTTAKTTPRDEDDADDDDFTDPPYNPPDLKKKSNLLSLSHTHTHILSRTSYYNLKFI